MKRFLFLPLAFYAFSSLFAQITVTNERSINSAFQEYSPAFYGKGLVFVAANPAVDKDKKEDTQIGRFTTSIFLAKRTPEGVLQRPLPFAEELTTRFYDGPMSFNATGDVVFFTRSNLKKGKPKAAKDGKVKLKIYSALLTNGQWTNITELPFCDGEADYAHPAISADGRRLFFSSNRSGGQGGMDLYVSIIQNGVWGEPVNLGPKINTAKDEIFPFSHASGVLFFSTNGRQGVGGLDIFWTKQTGNGWMSPTILPETINSTSDDFGLILNENRTNGYFASNRASGQGDDDIYNVSIPDGLEILPTSSTNLEDDLFSNKPKTENAAAKPSQNVDNQQNTEGASRTPKANTVGNAQQEAAKLAEQKSEQARIEALKKAEEEKREQAKIAEQKRVEEQQRAELKLAEQKRLADKKREEAEILEQKRQEADLAEQKRVKAEIAIAKQKEAAQAEKKREEMRIAEQKRQEANLSEEKKKEAKIAEQKRKDDEIAEQKRMKIAADMQKREEERLVEEKKAETRLAEERQKEAKIAEQKREEAKSAEQKREEARLAEAKIAEQKKEEARLAEAKIAEQKIEKIRIEQQKREEARIAEAKIEEQKKEEAKIAEAKLTELKIEKIKIEQQKREETRLAEEKIAYQKREELRLAEEKRTLQIREEKRVEEAKIAEQKREELRQLEAKIAEQKREELRQSEAKIAEQRREEKRFEEAKITAQKREEMVKIAEKQKNLPVITENSTTEKPIVDAQNSKKKGGKNPKNETAQKVDTQAFKTTEPSISTENKLPNQASAPVLQNMVIAPIAKQNNGQNNAQNNGSNDFGETTANFDNAQKHGQTAPVLTPNQEEHSVKKATENAVLTPSESQNTEGYKYIETAVATFDKTTNKIIAQVKVGVIAMKSLKNAVAVTDIYGKLTGLRSDDGSAIALDELPQQSELSNEHGRVKLPLVIGERYLFNFSKVGYEPKFILKTILTTDNRVAALLVPEKFTNVKPQIAAVEQPKIEAQKPVNYGENAAKMTPIETQRITYTEGSINSQNIVNQTVRYPSSTNNAQVVDTNITLSDNFSDAKNMSQTLTQGRTFELKNIYYGYGDAELNEPTKLELEPLVTMMQQEPDMVIEIAAHTDSRGKAPFNLNLSQLRADNIKSFLVEKDIAPERIKSIGYGETRLKNRCSDNVNCTEDEHQINRRTEIRVLKGGKWLISTPKQDIEVQKTPNTEGVILADATLGNPAKYAQIPSNNDRYLVIVGTYAKPSNAEKQRVKVVASGFVETELIQFKDNLFFGVCVRHFDNFQEAQALSNYINAQKEFESFVKELK